MTKKKRSTDEEDEIEERDLKKLEMLFTKCSLPNIWMKK